MLTILFRSIRRNRIHMKGFTNKQKILNIYCGRCYCQTTDDDRKQYMHKLFGWNDEYCDWVLNEKKLLRNATTESIEKSKNMLQKLGFTMEEVGENPVALAIRPATIEHHYMILEEGGFHNITVPMLLKYVLLVKKNISLLKLHNLLLPETNVMKNFLSYLEEPPSHVKPLSSSDDHLVTFIKVQEDVLKYYIMWRLEMNLEEVEKLIVVYSRLRNRSFRLMKQSLDILENELGFSKEKIRRNGYLIHSHPDNTLDTIRNVKSLGGLDINSVFISNPKIIMTATPTLIKIAQYLKEYGISDLSIQRCLHIFTLSSESVRKRLQRMESVPEFQVLRSNPRVLRLIHYQNKAMSRLDFLHEQKVRCASLHVLSATRAQFEKYARDGDNRTRGSDVVHYLGSVLGGNEAAIRQDLKMHIFWGCVPLVSMCGTLETLLARGFSKSAVLHCIQILLYPRKRVEEELDLLPTRDEVSTAQQMYSKETLTDEVQLSLCIYFIERVHHFTGNGIWTTIDDSTEVDTTLLGVRIPKDASDRQQIATKSARVRVQ